MVYLSYRYSQTKRTYKQEHKEHNLSAAACALLTAVCCLPAHITAAGGAALSDRRFWQILSGLSGFDSFFMSFQRAGQVIFQEVIV
ncbi:hypothetical protein CLOM621_08556 [Clostridium sp. M62/1]|nr:hypothetical protein CLOM621_08556 [Clostridium sp. M62/1]